MIPTWIQFQILTQDLDTSVAWNGGIDVAGHSIVNPASSANPGLVAVAARNMRTTGTTPSLMDYSSQGPVYSPMANLRTDTPDRIKPDATAASGAATHTKWLHDCNQNADTCGDDLYFGGTSAATGHTGGLAALVVQLFKDIGAQYTAADVAKYLKDSGKHLVSTEPKNNYRWGNGFIELSCRPQIVSFPYTGSPDDDEWAIGDCKSTRLDDTYSDYFTFHIAQSARVKIDLKSVTDSYLFLLNSPSRAATQIWPITTTGEARETPI